MSIIGELIAIAKNDPWRDRALCAQADPEAFFPERGGSAREARRICQLCPVATECLLYALRNDERWGMWGGYTEYERRALKRGSARCVTRPECGTRAGFDKHYKRGEPACNDCRAAAAARNRQNRAVARTRSGEDRKRSLSQGKR